MRKSKKEQFLQFVDWFEEATANIKDVYFNLPVDSGESKAENIYRERVYCYDLKKPILF